MAQICSSRFGNALLNQITMETVQKGEGRGGVGDTGVLLSAS